jgi:isocitrate dehydrogenase
MFIEIILSAAVALEHLGWAEEASQMLHESQGYACKFNSSYMYETPAHICTTRVFAAVALEHLGWAEEASKMLREAVAVSSNDHDLWYSLGRHLDTLGASHLCNTTALDIELCVTPLHLV